MSVLRHVFYVETEELPQLLPQDGSPSLTGVTRDYRTRVFSSLTTVAEVTSVPSSPGSWSVLYDLDLLRRERPGATGECPPS